MICARSTPKTIKDTIIIYGNITVERVLCVTFTIVLGNAWFEEIKSGNSIGLLCNCIFGLRIREVRGSKVKIIVRMVTIVIIRRKIVMNTFFWLS